MQERRVAALITCHNRREKTLLCLSALFDQDMLSKTTLEVYLVDDGSTDGTAEAVQAAYPEVKVWRGDGSLFWNGGMRLAFAEAMKVGYDYYLWLNDDTLLDDHAISSLLTTYRRVAEYGKPCSIIV